jgi:hypothetical protein
VFCGARRSDNRRSTGRADQLASNKAEAALRPTSKAWLAAYVGGAPDLERNIRSPAATLGRIVVREAQLELSRGRAVLVCFRIYIAQ